MTHSDLVKHAERWLMKTKGCPFALTELVTGAFEIPDAIGWRAGYSVLVECKASRADFLSDAKKIHRQHPGQGMGAFRFYMCPSGLIQPEEIPDKWGLVWIWPGGRRRQVKGPKGNCFSPSSDPEFYFSERQNLGETLMLVSALRRIYLRGDLHKIYSSPFKTNGTQCFNKGCPDAHRINYCMRHNPGETSICPARQLKENKV